MNICERFYECFTPAQLMAAGWPSSEAACVTQGQAEEGCAAQNTMNACDGNQRYHPSEAAKCVDQIAGLTCAQLRDLTLDLGSQIPACDKMCSIDP